MTVVRSDRWHVYGVTVVRDDRLTIVSYYRCEGSQIDLFEG